MLKLGEFMLSIVIPLFNEEQNLEPLYGEIKKTVPKFSKSLEIIFVDDGSTDGSLDFLKDLVKKDKIVRVYSFRKNIGRSEALTLGFQKAKGDYIATLDADLQDKPSEIGKLLKKAKEERWDVVCGWRKNRKDPLKKVISSMVFNKLAGIFWGLNLHDYNGGLKLYKKEAAKSLNLYGGLHRFIPILVHKEGFSVTEVPVVHEKRLYGKSKYGFSKIWKNIPDLFTMLFLIKYGNRPLHFFGLAGGILFFSGFSILAYLSVIHFQGQAIGRRPLLFFGMLLILSGFQVFFTGFLADLMINISQRNEKTFPIKYSSD
ncbi:MAG: glycosyltransferase family 2 protein [Candidatus Levybacteria bacterium]|nr:glycosyltransferase family 2 protein [Candidatus Levybacteria bacterium]